MGAQDGGVVAEEFLVQGKGGGVADVDVDYAVGEESEGEC